jgi:transposase
MRLTTKNYRDNQASSSPEPLRSASSFLAHEERRLQQREEAEKFYRDLAARGMTVRVGMEASGHARWFERLLFAHPLRTDLGCVPDPQLKLQLWHRHRMVQARTRIMNQLQAVALNEGLRCKEEVVAGRAGRGQLEAFQLAPWASQRRGDLLELLDRLNPTIGKLTQAIDLEVEKCPAARRLKTHPGVGSLTALAFVLIIGKADRFECGKQIASYLGLVPLEKSSGNQRRLGHITKQGNSLLRFLLVEAAQVTVRSLPEWRTKYVHLTMRRGRKIAKVAMARKLAVRLYWMLRKEWDYERLRKFGSYAGEPGNRDGVK